jgi:CheY-like chemotaxis protein
MDLLARRDRTVVVIDDDRDIAEVVQTILLDEGLTVSCLYLQDAGDVRAAIERIEPDCVLLDGGDLRHAQVTWETAAWLATRPHPIPTILMTADSHTRDEAVVDLSQRAKAARVVGIIPKPFNIDQVVSAVLNAIGEAVGPVTDAEELSLHVELVDRLRVAGARDLATSTIGRSWVTFTAGRSPSTFNVYRWRAAGAYFIGRYRAGGAQMEPLGQFTDLDALIAYCSKQIRDASPPS